MRSRDNADWVPSPVSTYIMPSKNSTEKASKKEYDNTDVYHKLDYEVQGSDVRGMICWTA